MTQIPLGLTLPPRFGRDDFLASPSNRAALDRVDAWPHWPDSVLLLVGPPGSGKTHLGHIWAARAKAWTLASGAAVPDLPELASTPGLIDDADRAALPEASFFHLLNLSRQARVSLLITARRPPDLWGLRTPDLLSRLRLAPLVTIYPPDDDLVRAVLLKLFHDRQLRVERTLIDYLTLRLERSLGAVRTIVEALDLQGWSEGRRITRAMASDLLATLGQDDD